MPGLVVPCKGVWKTGISSHHPFWLEDDLRVRVTPVLQWVFNLAGRFWQQDTQGASDPLDLHRCLSAQGRVPGKRPLDVGEAQGCLTRVSLSLDNKQTILPCIISVDKTSISKRAFRLIRLKHIIISSNILLRFLPSLCLSLLQSLLTLMIPRWRQQLQESPRPISAHW